MYAPLSPNPMRRTTQADRQQTLSRAMAAESSHGDETQDQGMRFGMQSMKIRYLHILIILIKDVPMYQELRLNSSRQVLEVLPQMVSHWNEVYGVIW